LREFLFFFVPFRGYSSFTPGRLEFCVTYVVRRISSGIGAG
jgi:hypothetical protein